MELSDSFTVESPASKVWELLWDFPRLASCMPGCEEVEALDESNFKARVKQSVGPFRVEMDINFTIQEATPEERILVTGSGGDRRGNSLKINRAMLEMAPVSPKETQISYSIDFTLFGKLATLGYPMVKRKSRDVAIEFTRRISDALEKG